LPRLGSKAQTLLTATRGSSARASDRGSPGAAADGRRALSSGPSVRAVAFSDKGGMFKSILIPTDGSNLSDKAVREGARTGPGAWQQGRGGTRDAPFHVLAATRPPSTPRVRSARKDAAPSTRRSRAGRQHSPRARRGLHLCVAYRRARYGSRSSRPRKPTAAMRSAWRLTGAAVSRP